MPGAAIRILLRALLLGVPAALGVLASAAALAAEPRSTLDEPEMRRLLDDLDAEVGWFTTELRRYLQRSGRWEPGGPDRDLWEQLQGFGDAVDRAEDRYSGGSRAGDAGDAGALLKRGREVEGGLSRVDLDRSLHEDWGQIRGKLVHLARSYGWDYERDHFDGASAGAARDDERRSGSGYGTAREDEVRSVLDEVDRRSRVVTTRLRQREMQQPEDALIGIGEGLLRDVSGVGASVTPRSRLVSDLAAFDRSVDAAQRRLQTTRRADEIEPEVETLLRLARAVDASMGAASVAQDVVDAWDQVRRELDGLAGMYGLSRLPAR